MNHKSGMHGQILKISKKLLGRTFTLGMILDYCTKHTNHTSAPPIISMLNVFLRNSGNSTQEERDIIDQVEYKLLNNEVDDIRFFEDLINEDQLQEDDMEEPGDCFKFMNDFIKQKVETVVNIYYQGSSANLTLIEITFFDHNLLKKRNGHTALIKTLCAWGTIDQLSEKEMKKVMSGMASKMHTLPTNGYMEWDGSIYFNDKKICQDIGKDLGEIIKYSRKKEKKNDSTSST